MSHSLDGATLRVERAVKHFDELCEVFVAFREANVDKVFFKGNPGPPQNLTISFDSSLVIPPILSLIVSDCIHNLRAALDYLVYELAILDSGAIQDGTQFPIEDDPKVFDVRRRKHLRGLCDDHVGAVEGLQPYKGVEWTKTLRAVSNPDKHRHLVMLQPQVSPSIMVHFSGMPGDFEFTVSGEKVYLKKDYAFTVGFSDGQLPVIETLNRLLVKVGETINAFKTEFK